MIGKRIAALMAELNLSQNELAAQLGISAAAVHKLRLDQSQPSANTLLKLARIYNVSYDWLLEGRGEVFRHTAGMAEEHGGVELTLLTRAKDAIIEQLLQTNRTLVQTNAELIKLNQGGGERRKKAQL